MNWKHYLSIGLSAFATGGLGYLATHLTGVPTTTQGLSAAAIGFVTGGAIAVAHLLQPAPSAQPPAAS